MQKIGFAVASIVIVLALLASTAFVVDQREFGVVFEFGHAKRAIAEPGLYFKLPPPFQNVSRLDKRLLTLTSSQSDTSSVSVLTAEKQPVVIDWYVRWRITDPLAYVRNVGLDEAAGALQLNPVVRNAFQEEVNRRTMQELISSKREEVMNSVKQAVEQTVKNGDKPWGIDIVDVRLMRADYAESITSSVYNRMRAERKRVASELRAKGAAEAEQIRADADRQRVIVIANANREAQKIKGEGDAQAARIYADAFGKDPAFAAFYRSLDAYKASLGKKGDVMVIDPASSEFFRVMQQGGSAAGPAPAPAEGSKH